MAKIHEVDGKKYVEVERKAKVGEKIIVTKEWYSQGVGSILNVIDGSQYNFTEDDYQVYFDHPKNKPGTIKRIENEYYRVLEQVNEPDVTDIIANLARRVASLEQQLADAQRNIERMGYEQSETGAKVEMLTNDIIMLDERTMTKQADVVTFEKFLDSIADKVAERLVR